MTKRPPSRRPTTKQKGAPKKSAPKTKAAAKKPKPLAPLKGHQKSFLRGLGHHRDPIVQIGQRGLTGEVLKELDHALVAHELLKVKLLKSAPLSVAEAAKQMADESGAQIAQTIGKVVLLYRPSPDPTRRKIRLPERRDPTDEEPTEDLVQTEDASDE